MSARDAILGNVRKAVEAKPNDAARQALAHKRIAQRERHPIPDRVSGKTTDALHGLFREHLETASATVATAANADDIPEIISNYLRQHNLPQQIRHGADETLATINWGQAPTLEVMTGAADRNDAVGLSRATAAVAETGTLVLASGPDNPVTLNFLPETHIVVVDQNAIVGPYEEAFDRVRTRFGDGKMPRTVNMVSGPSRTGDIGGRIVMGAHGPRRMMVVIVESGLDP
ncbi:MAG: lactate utilization protein [Pseudomonadota bacterium]